MDVQNLLVAFEQRVESGNDHRHHDWVEVYIVSVCISQGNAAFLSYLFWCFRQQHKADHYDQYDGQESKCQSNC